ncbi:MAG: HAMP domain-containing sensor histidine kinase [Vicinamibacterales bacterium]
MLSRFVADLLRDYTLRAMRWPGAGVASLGAWWRLFAVSIALPALALAWLGLRAVRAETVQERDRVREQQRQAARLVDGAIANLLADLETRLRQPDAAWGSNLVPLVFDTAGVVTVPGDRVYFSDVGREPSERRMLVSWSPQIAGLVEEAQSFEAQARVSDAGDRLRRIERLEPGLGEWSALVSARVRFRSGDTRALTELADPSRAASPAVSPSGTPVALVAALTAGEAPPAERVRFAALIEQTQRGLRAGRWWLGAAERRAYDTELTRLARAAGASTDDSMDARLAWLATLDEMARAAPPYRRDGPSRALVRTPAGVCLVIWTPSTAASTAWAGLVIPRDGLAALLEPALTPILGSQAYGSALRDRWGDAVWTAGAVAAASPWHVEPVLALEGWQLAFSAPLPVSWRSDPRLLWYSFIGLLIVFLVVGLGATARSVRHEVELARRQSEFVGAVSHEFKSPITSIRLLVERIVSGRLGTPSELEGYQRAITRETDRLERLVNRVLAAQQIEAGHRAYEMAPTDIRDLIAHAVAHLQPHADARRITIVVRIDDDVPPLLMLDATTLGEAIENLLDNALKYSPPDTTVRVTCARRGNDLYLDVADQGIGIDADEIERVFDRFYRARRGNLHNVRGTGLGLWLVKTAVEGHGGRVSAVSAPGAGTGTTFTIVLPIGAAADPSQT